MRRALALVFALHVAATPSPARAASQPVDDPVTLHNLGLELREAGQHLEAARQWLRALATVEPTDAHALEVESHFCEAMESLTAAAEQGADLEVRDAIAARRSTLDAGAELVRRHGDATNTRVCLERWTTLTRPSAPPPPVVDTLAEDPLPASDPSPPPRAAGRSPRGLWAGLGVSVIGVTAGAVLLGVGGARMKASHDQAEAAWIAAGFDGERRLCSDPAMPPGAAAHCDDYDNQQVVAGVGAGVLAASLVSTAVFAGLLGRHRARHPVAVAGARVPGGALLQAAWRF